MSQDKRWLIVGLVVGCIIGFVARSLTGGEGRFTLKEAPGLVGAVYKVDTRTGQTWLVYGGQETPVK